MSFLILMQYVLTKNVINVFVNVYAHVIAIINKIVLAIVMNLLDGLELI